MCVWGEGGTRKYPNVMQFLLDIFLEIIVKESGPFLLAYIQNISSRRDLSCLTILIRISRNILSCFILRKFSKKVNCF
jgi:hypothetical protein